MYLKFADFDSSQSFHRVKVFSLIHTTCLYMVKLHIFIYPSIVSCMWSQKKYAHIYSKSISTVTFTGLETSPFGGGAGGGG